MCCKLDSRKIEMATTPGTTCPHLNTCQLLTKEQVTQHVVQLSEYLPDIKYLADTVTLV